MRSDGSANSNESIICRKICLLKTKLIVLRKFNRLLWHVEIEHFVEYWKKCFKNNFPIYFRVWVKYLYGIHLDISMCVAWVLGVSDTMKMHFVIEIWVWWQFYILYPRDIHLKWILYCMPFSLINFWMSSKYYQWHVNFRVSWLWRK